LWRAIGERRINKRFAISSQQIKSTITLITVTLSGKKKIGFVRLPGVLSLVSRVSGVGIGTQSDATQLTPKYEVLPY